MGRAVEPWLLGLATLILLSGCAGTGTSTASGTGPGSRGDATDAAGPATGAAPLQKVQIALTLPSVSFLVFGVADHAGIAKSEGLDLEIVSAGTNVALAAMTAGEIGYTAQIGSVMRGVPRGLDARTLAVFLDAPLQTLVVRPEIQRAQDLVGKTIGVGTADSTTQITAVAMLEAFGLREDQVQWAPLGAGPTRVAALSQGLVQATALSPPFDVAAERDHGFPIVMRASDVMRSPFVGLTTSTRRIQERPDEIKRVLRTLIRANEFIRDRPAEAAEIATRWVPIDDPDIARRSLDLAIPVLTRGGAADRKGFAWELASIQKLAELSQPPKVEDVTDFRLLEEVQRELGLPVGGLRD
jgi:NitT/TauT family transport system substrate-binding protein